MLDRLRHVELSVTDADVYAVGDRVGVTGYRLRWPHCVTLQMSREDAAILGEMLRDIAVE